MSALLDSLAYGWGWLLLGIVLGWLLSRLCGNYCRKAKEQPAATPSPVASEPAPAKAASTTVTAEPAKTAAAPKASPAKTVTLDIATAKANGFSIKEADDLNVIEGIGPKINALFKANGLSTFALVANASVADMRAVLEKGGARFRIANPGTWAQQAALAADNQWAELKKLQQKLSGGRK